jgi:hypothetical protein
MGFNREVPFSLGEKRGGSGVKGKMAQHIIIKGCKLQSEPPDIISLCGCGSGFVRTFIFPAARY